MLPASRRRDDGATGQGRGVRESLAAPLPIILGIAAKCNLQFSANSVDLHDKALETRPYEESLGTPKTQCAQCGRPPGGLPGGRQGDFRGGQLGGLSGGLHLVLAKNMRALRGIHPTTRTGSRSRPVALAWVVRQTPCKGPKRKTKRRKKKTRAEDEPSQKPPKSQATAWGTDLT